MSLPSTMKGLVLNADDTITLNSSLPFPSPTPGSVTVRVLSTIVNSNFVNSLRGAADANTFTSPRPHTPGSNAIARVVAVGPDAVALKPGQLVFVDANVRARDDLDTQIIWGIFDGMTPQSKKLFAESWRDGTLAEYTRAPLENTYALDEELLCGDVKNGGFGYSHAELMHIFTPLVPYAGLRSMRLEAGQTVLISPATGGLSGAAVAVALAMGAKVIAASRSAEGLARLKSVYPDVSTAILKGNEEDGATIASAAKGRPIDAFFELSPPAATGSPLVTTCMLSVRHNGQICLMGNRGDTNIPMPWLMLLFKNLTIKGQFMYQREDVYALIKLVESGRLRLGDKNGFGIEKVFGLEDWEEAGDLAVKVAGFGKMVTMAP